MEVEKDIQVWVTLNVEYNDDGAIYGKSFVEYGTFTHRAEQLQLTFSLPADIPLVNVSYSLSYRYVSPWQTVVKSE